MIRIFFIFILNLAFTTYSLANEINMYFCIGNKHIHTQNNKIVNKLAKVPNLYLTWNKSKKIIFTSNYGYKKENATLIFMITKKLKNGFAGHELMNKNHIIEFKNYNLKTGLVSSSKNYQSSMLNFYSCNFDK